ITRDIPNISENFLRNLDESGVIRIGATIRPGDILVGKVTPKGETTLTPEDVKIFCRKGAEKDERHKAIESSQVFRLERNLADEIRILTDERLKRLTALLSEQ